MQHLLCYEIVVGLVLSLAASCAHATQNAVASTSDPASHSVPNIVVVYIDDLDFDELEPYDYRKFPVDPVSIPSAAELRTGRPSQPGAFLEAPMPSNDAPTGVGESIRVGMHKGTHKSGLSYGDMLQADGGSLSLWLKAEAVQGQDYVFRTRGFKLMFENPSSFKAIYRNGKSPWNELGKTRVPVGEWIHAALTWNREEDSLDYYVNGSMVASVDDAKLDGLSNGGITVGSFQLIDNDEHLENQFKGLIYAPHFFERVLTRSDLKKYYEKTFD